MELLQEIIGQDLLVRKNIFFLNKFLGRDLNR